MTTLTPRILAAHFNREWHRLSADPAAVARLAAWPDPARAYPTLDALLDATGMAGGGTVAGADEVLASVVAAAADDAVAARVVLQRLVPGLVLVAVRRTRHRPSARQALFDDLAANAWILIRTYPLHRRPTKIAVNLLRDAEYHTCTRPGRLRSADEQPVAPTVALWTDRAADGVGRPLAHGRHPADELAALLAEGRSAGLDESDLALLHDLVLGGHSVAEMARRLQVTPRTVYNRRVAVTARLAELAA
jgi:hypothetical protein